MKKVSITLRDFDTSNVDVEDNAGYVSFDKLGKEEQNNDVSASESIPSDEEPQNNNIDKIEISTDQDERCNVCTSVISPYFIYRRDMSIDGYI
ncbi:hypothetical protein V1478_015624 [Vespula squamosa]|uniref:Uncharacterized protein n=1 Tax=Vespula squamosa TaxID=30214 RepID=A0ABD2A1D6_VESSQ